MKFRFLVLALAAAAAFAVSCGPIEDDGGGVGRQPTVDAAAPEATKQSPVAHPGAFEAMLARVPDTETARESLLITDIEAVRKYAGIETPAQGVHEEPVEDYLRLIGTKTRDGGPATIFAREGAWLAGFHGYALEATTGRTLGIDARNVDQIALFQDSPPHIAVEILAGRYDRDASKTALDECADCVPPSLAEHDGVTFWSWGEDSQMSLRDQLKPPAFDQLGRGGRIWVGDGFAVRTVRTADMHQVIDASLDRAPSLADDEDYVLAARALSDLDVTSAIFSGMSFQSDDLFELLKPLTTGGAFQTSKETLRERLRQPPLLRPFDLIAAGTASDGTEPYTALVLVHRDRAAASANVEPLQQRIESSVWQLNAPLAREAGEPPKAEPRYWRDVISRHEVTADGRVLVARLYGARAEYLVTTEVLGGLMWPLTVHE